MIDFNFIIIIILLSNTPGEKQAAKKKARRGREPHCSLVPSSIGSKIPASKTWQGSLCTTLARYEKILYKNSFTKIYKFFLKSKPSSIGSKIPASETWQGSLFTTLARYDKILYKNSFTKI